MPSTLLKEAQGLEEFDLSKNEIKMIKSGTFAQLTKLKSLMLSENLICKCFKNILQFTKILLINSWISFGLIRWPDLLGVFILEKKLSHSNQGRSPSKSL